MLREIAMASSYPRGSEWRRSDLHVHSPLSYLNNQYPKLPNGEPDWEPFLAALESSRLAIVGVTDYFSIDGYKKLLEFQGQGRLAGITLLPNIEFRLDIVAQTRTSGPRQRLNLHVIFSDDVSAQDIEEHFLHDLSFFCEGNPQGSNYSYKLKRQNLEALGERLKQEHSSFQGAALTIGAQNAVVSQAEISGVLAASGRFKGKYLIVLPEHLSCLIDWDGQDHNLRKVLLQSADMLFTSNPHTRSWCLGKPPYEGGLQAFVQEFKSRKPCIHGSDAHRIEDIGRPCRKRGERGHDCEAAPLDCDLASCWIKADPTFEGLKQLLYEPGDRVRIQAEDPTPVKSLLSLRSVMLESCQVNDDLAIHQTQLPLNRDLVAVVGGKGSGKTALVDLVANCFLDRAKTGDKNAFVRRIADDRPALAVTVGFRNDATFTKRILDGQFSETGDIVYIAQGELEEYVDEHSDLEHHIEALIFASPAVSESVAKHEYETLRLKRNEEREDLSRSNATIAALEHGTATAGAESLEKELKKRQAELADLTVRVEVKEKQLTPERRTEAETQMQALTTLRERLQLLEERRALLREVRRFLRTDVAKLNASVDEINKAQERLQDARRLGALTYEGSDIVDTLLSETEEATADLAHHIEDLGKTIQAQADDVQDHAKLLGKKKECANQIEVLKKSIAKRTADCLELETQRTNRKPLLQSLFATELALQAKYTAIIQAFAGRKGEILGDLDFVANLKFEKERFLQAAERVLDNRRVTVRPLDDKPSDLAPVITACEGLLTVNGISTLVEVIETTAEEYCSRLKQAADVSSYYDTLYASYFALVPTVKYRGIGLGKLSLGQKATVLIKIHLAQGTTPIIIDSHDDHLDNEFIMEELVHALRVAKAFRQVIVVSNNGNVVVNSDAEQVILATREAGTIRYESGSLEDPGLRDALLRVLEGGREAFTRRQQKYRLSE